MAFSTEITELRMWSIFHFVSFLSCLFTFQLLNTSATRAWQENRRNLQDSAQVNQENGTITVKGGNTCMSDYSSSWDWTSKYLNSSDDVGGISTKTLKVCLNCMSIKVYAAIISFSLKPPDKSLTKRLIWLWLNLDNKVIIIRWK